MCCNKKYKTCLEIELENLVIFGVVISLLENGNTVLEIPKSSKAILIVKPIQVIEIAVAKVVVFFVAAPNEKATVGIASVVGVVVLLKRGILVSGR